MPTPFEPPLTEVLIVDDDPDILELLSEYFAHRGLKVAAASDGRAAVSAIERDPARYGLVVTDLQLPGVDGLGVLEAARAANPSAYVVIITGYASLDSAIQAVRLGAYDYLTKPFSLGQLEVVLRRVQDRTALEAENRRLLKQMAGRQEPDARVSLDRRLEAIEQRLARIEGLLEGRSRPGR
ncbi:MAG: response regulator [Vicinamibacteraceae bacterium]|nr:response regulator [Vicinamibacteraceae bacterium]